MKMENAISIFSKDNIKKIPEKLKGILKKEKVLYDIYAILLLFLPIFITLDKYVGFIGTILTGLPFVLGILSVFIYQRKKILKYILIVILFIVNAFFSTDLNEQFEFVKPLVIFLTCFDMVQDVDFLKTIKKYLEKYYKFVLISIALILVLNIGFLIFNNAQAMSDKYSSDWDISAFEGLYDDPNQAAYRFCSMLVFVIFYIRAGKNNNIVNVILLIALEGLTLMTGARTPTAMAIALGMIGIYFLREPIFELFKKYKKISITASIIIVVALVIYLPQTAFIQKNLVAAEGTFDNGRTIMRDAGMNYFINSDIQNKLFGNDINTIYNINKQVMHAYIWSHNDMLQILLQFGIIMLVIYFETIIYSMIYCLKGQTKFKKLIIVLLNITFLFVGFYNGLFFHPRFVVAIPVIFAIFKLYELKEESKREA